MQCWCLGLLCLLAALSTSMAQSASGAGQRPVPPTFKANAPQGGDLSLDNFEYQYGNTASLAGPATYQDGLDKGQVAGIVIGCVLFGVLAGALSMLCWVKRKRLFPDKYGPCEHPDEAPPVAPIDVLRSGSKLDTLTKSELGDAKSFSTAAVNRV